MYEIEQKSQFLSQGFQIVQYDTKTLTHSQLRMWICGF